MPFEVLSDECLKKMLAESTLGVDGKGYRFVNLSLSVLLIAEMERQHVLPDDKRPVSGADLLQTMRFVGGSMYGMLAPNVFANWGFKRDTIVRSVVKTLFVYNGIFTNDEMLDYRHYRGKRLLQPIESLDDLEAFDSILQEMDK